MDRKESVCGDFAEPEFPNDDVMRESNTMYDSLNTNALLAADEVFDIHIRCSVRYLILVCDASFVRPRLCAFRDLKLVTTVAALCCRCCNYSCCCGCHICHHPSSICCRED